MFTSKVKRNNTLRNFIKGNPGLSSKTPLLKRRGGVLVSSSNTNNPSSTSLNELQPQLSTSMKLTSNPINLLVQKANSLIKNFNKQKKVTQKQKLQSLRFWTKLLNDSNSKMSF